jgi:hypothetical protein
MTMHTPYPITPYHRPSQAMHAIPSPKIGRRISLIALQEELQLPTRHGLVGTRILKSVRIEQVSVLPDALRLPRSPLREPGPGSAQLAAAPRRTLPPPQPEPPELEGWLDGQLVHLRSVGEAMTDEAGNFYEVLGQQLRPLGELVSDEQGRIFEVQPAREAQPTATEQPRASAGEPEQIRLSSTTHNGHHVETPSRPARTQVIQTEPSPAFRTIVTDPGLYLQLPWARVKSELAPHLKHPEKLRDDDLLECYAQIYEAQRMLPAAELATLALSDAALASQLQPLTQAKAQKLGAPQLFKPTREPFEMRAASRQIYAGQRVYRLWPVFDPTIERDNTSSRPSVASAGKATELRNQIPQQYLNPLQFKCSREEVLYDMQGMLGTLPPQAHALTRWICIYPLRLLKVFRIVSSSSRRLKKWRAMLKGKSPDEQLWAVTPPRGFSYHPTVRRWAEETLAQSGYDPGHMVVEWEVFWRRKGWN